jgi:hypothetical protein
MGDSEVAPLRTNERVEQEETGNDQREFFEHYRTQPLIRRRSLEAYGRGQGTPHAQHDPPGQRVGEKPKEQTEHVSPGRGSSSDPTAQQGDRDGGQPLARSEWRYSCPQPVQHATTVVLSPLAMP